MEPAPGERDDLYVKHDPVAVVVPQWSPLRESGMTVTVVV